MNCKFLIFSMVVIAGLLWMLLPSVFACSCIESTVEQRIENAQVIFSGKLYGNTWKYDQHHLAGNFAVQKVWKGADAFPQIQTGNVKVITGIDDGICGVPFIPENNYLIFAQIDDSDLKTSTCSGSWFLDGRQDDVSALEQIGSTHAFIDAREMKNSSDDCSGPGLVSFEQCESEKLTRNVLLPIMLSIPVIGISVFLIWRKRK